MVKINFAANCSAPITTNAGVVIEPYNNTVEGAVIYFNCDDGFIPNKRRMAVCQSNGQWIPKISSRPGTELDSVAIIYMLPCHSHDQM